MDIESTESQDYTAYDGYHKYDQDIAQNYEEYRRCERHWKQEDEFLEDYIRKVQINSLLDLPIGTGRFIRYYTNIKNITGIDISDCMLDEARKKLHFVSPNISVQLVQGDVFNLQFPPSHFDSTIVFRLFHLMPSKSVSLAIKELCRVTRKEIVVQTYVPMNKLYVLFKKVITKFTETHSNVQSTKNLMPWSHIEAYYHKQELFDREFSKFNFFPVVSKLLDRYESCEVRATIYAKKS